MNIPNELKGFPNFTLGKNKKPYQLDGVTAAESDNPVTWATFEDALTSQKSLGNEYRLVFQMGIKESPSGIVFIDLDGCRDPETGTIDPEGMKIVRLLNSYTAISQSGTGLHIFIVADKPGDRCRRKMKSFKEIEIYSFGRGATLTGNHLPGTPETIEVRQTELSRLYDVLFPEPVTNYEPTHETTSSGAFGLSDQEIRDIIGRAANWPTIRRLEDGYGASEEDLALCCHYAFYTRDESQIERLYTNTTRPQRVSSDGSKHWSREDYRRRTIQQALSLVRETYKPKVSQNPAEYDVPPIAAYDCEPGAVNGHELADHSEKRTITLITTDDIEHEEIDWIIKPFLARKKRTEFVGNPGEAKSFFVQQICEWQDKNNLGLESKGGLRLFYVLGRDMASMEFKKRQLDGGGYYRMLHNKEELDFYFSNPTDTDEFIEIMKPLNIDALVLDTRRDFYQGDAFNDEVAAVTSNNLRRIAEELNCAVVTIEHVVKSHTVITTQSIPGSIKWAGKLDQIWYVQKGEGDIIQLTSIKDRCMSGVKFLKCKFVQGFGLIRTDEEFIVRATLSTSAMAQTDTPGGRPSKISIDAARDVLSDLHTEFYTGNFITKAANQDFSERTAYRMLDMLEESCDIIKGEKKRKWIKKAAPDPEPAKTLSEPANIPQNGVLAGSFGRFENAQKRENTNIIPPDVTQPAKTIHSAGNIGRFSILAGDAPFYEAETVINGNEPDDPSLPKPPDWIIPDSENQQPF